MGALLSFFGGFKLDISELDTAWNELNEQIQTLIKNNPKVETIIEEIKTSKRKGSWATLRESIQKGEKVIDIKEFLKPNP